jgi:hypothetical protein
MKKDNLNDLEELGPLRLIKEALRRLPLLDNHNVTSADRAESEVGDPLMISVKTKYGDLAFSFTLEQLCRAMFFDFAELIKMITEEDIKLPANQNVVPKDNAIELYLNLFRGWIEIWTIYGHSHFIMDMETALRRAVKAHAHSTILRTLREMKAPFLNESPDASRQAKMVVKLAEKFAKDDMGAPGPGRRSDWSKWSKGEIRRTVKDIVMNLPQPLRTKNKVAQKINEQHNLARPLTASALEKSLTKHSINWKELKNGKIT